MTFTIDAPTVAFSDDADGITIDDNEETSIDWDDVDVVTIEDVPHAEAFDTKDFYRLPATVARPIEQPYQVDDSVVWMTKPKDELRQAAWSLDNKPWTLGHPDTGMVEDVHDIHGFWRNTRYVENVDDLDSDLHVPVDDEEGKAFLEQHGDVSVGFYHDTQAADEYDGELTSDAEVSGVQTDLYFNHAASVQRGRCPSEKGCGVGVAADSHDGHGHISGTTINTDSDAPVETDQNEDSRESSTQPSVSQSETVDQSDHTNEGSWYAVPPADNPDDAWKYRIDNCSDASDAWKLRHHGDISISVDTLEQRIRDRASDLDCELDFGTETSDSIDGYNITMSEECNCGDTNDGLDLSFDDLSPEAALSKVAAEHDDIETHLDEMQTRAEAASEAADELDCDVDALADTAGVLDDQVDELTEQLDELREPQKQEHAEFITERTDRFGDVDELMELDMDELESKREIVADLTSETSSKTANADSNDTDETQVVGGYVKSPWE